MKEFLEIVNTALPLVLIGILLYGFHRLVQLTTELEQECKELWDRCTDIEHRYGCALQKLIEVDRKIAQEITRLERTLRSSNAGNKKSGHDDIVDV